MPPEVLLIANLNVDPQILKKNFPNVACDPEKIDIFTVGVILFMLLVGNPPFEEATNRDGRYNLIIGQFFEEFLHTHLNAKKRPIHPIL